MITAYMMNLMSWRQEQARQMQQFMQALGQLGQAVGQAGKAYQSDQQADAAANTVNPPRAALVNPDPTGSYMNGAYQNNPELFQSETGVDTSGSSPYTGGRANLQAYLAAHRQLGGRGAQPYVPGQNPVTDYQRAMAMKRLNDLQNPPSSGYAAQSAANLQNNMGQVMDPNQLATGNAGDVNAQLQQVQPTPTADAATKAQAALKQADGTMSALSGKKIPNLATFEQMQQYAQTNPANGTITVGGQTYTQEQWAAMQQHYNSVKNAGSAATTAIAGSGGAATPGQVPIVNGYFPQNLSPQTGPNAQNIANPQTSVLSQNGPAPGAWGPNFWQQ